MRYRPDIDGLRAVAVIAVVLFHAGVPGFGGGYVGVDVFFVISGYLITGILQRDLESGRLSILDFYERRVRRIFPALFAMVLFCTVMGYLLLLPNDLARVGLSIIAATFFVSNVLFWTETGYFDAPAETKPLLHTWSLAVEEQFYIVFPIYLFLIWRFARHHRGPLTLWILGLSFLASVWLVTTRPTGAFYLAPARAWELLLGSCLAMGLVPEVRWPVVQRLLPTIGAGAIGLSVVTYSPATPFPGLHALLPCLGTALIIHSGALGDSVVRRVLSTKPLVFVGKISYSLYLWHWPLLVFADYYAVRELTAFETGLIVVLSVAGATLSWRFIETPFRGRDALLSRRALFGTTGTVMAAATATGGFITLNEGMPSRVESQVAQLAAGATDKHPDLEGCDDRSAGDVEQGNLCRLGVDNGSNPPSFLVWGDSHAAALLPAVDRAAAAWGRSGLAATRAGCPPLLGVGQARAGYNDECIDFGLAVGDLLASMPSVDTVILAARWALYASGVRYGRERGSLVSLIDDQSGVAPPKENQQIFQAGLARTIAKLTDLGKRIVVVHQIPEVGWDVPTALARVQLFDRPIAIEPRLVDYLLRQQLIHDMLAQYEAKHSIDIIYPHELLCYGLTCRIEIAGRVLYYDTNHLSLTGAEFVSRLFEPTLRGTNDGLRPRRRKAAS